MDKVTRQCPQTTIKKKKLRERRAEAVSNRGPSAYSLTLTTRPNRLTSGFEGGAVLNNGLSDSGSVCFLFLHFSHLSQSCQRFFKIQF